MNTVLKKLKSEGCDIDNAMGRFLNDEDFYMECLPKLLQDVNFENLKTALVEGNVTDGFNYAHTLKGVIANMGLTPLYDAVVKIVEPLRTGNAEGLMVYYDELIRVRDSFKVIAGI